MVFLLAILLAVGGIQTLHAAEPSALDGVIVSSALADFNDLDSPVSFMSSEFDPSLLDQLPVPTSPPVRVVLPNVVADKGQWRGSQSGIVRSTHAVFRDPDLWTKFWALAIAPYSARLHDKPPIDFTRDMIVGVFMGEKPYPSYQVEIRSVRIERQDDERVLTVRYRNIQRMPAVFSPPFSVQPFHLIKTPLFNGRVAFIDDSN